MSSYAGPDSNDTENIAETLRLLAWFAVCVALIAADHQGGWLRIVRSQAELLIQPLWKIAGTPARLGKAARENAVSREQLVKDNAGLRNALLISSARVARLASAEAENTRLRALLGVAQEEKFSVQLAPILDIDLDPTRQRLMLDIGANQGVRVGQPVIDAGGLLGQVTEVKPSTASVLLLTDPDHAVPVQVVRTGMRLIVYGRADHLTLANIPRSADIKVGDVVQTSGIGGRFPPGFPVGTITKLHPDVSRAFVEGDLKPAALMDRGRDVLLLNTVLVPVRSAPANVTTVAAPIPVDATLPRNTPVSPKSPAAEATEAAKPEPTP